MKSFDGDYINEYVLLYYPIRLPENSFRLLCLIILYYLYLRAAKHQKFFPSFRCSYGLFVYYTASALRQRWNPNSRIYAPSPKITLLSSLLMRLKTLTHTHTFAHTTCRQQLIIFISYYTQPVPRNGPRVCVYLYFITSQFRM